MARFFFHIVNDTFTTLDQEGSEQPNMRAACDHARTVIGGIIKDELRSANGAIHLTVMIDDADRVRVANIKTITTIAETTNPFAD